MRYSLHKKRLSIAKPHLQPQTPTPRSSLPFTFTRTKKLSHSLLQPKAQRYDTQPTPFDQDKYITSITQIRRLKEELKRVTERKARIANPEYFVNVEEDISAWQNSIAVMKEEIEGLRREGNVRVKKVDSREKRERELFRSIQEEIKGRNSLSEKVAGCQQQIEYFKEKNESSRKEMEVMENSGSNAGYLNKLKQIQSIQHETSITSQKLEEKYSSISQELKEIDSRIEKHETSISQCQNQLFQSMAILNRLTFSLYSPNPHQAISLISEREEEEENEFI